MSEHPHVHHLQESLHESRHDPDLISLDTVIEAPLIAAPSSAREVLRKGGPRMARDAFVPFIAFFGVYKLVGLVAGVAVATLAAVAAWTWERRRERTGIMATMALLLILVRSIVTLVANSATGDEELAAKIYLAQPIVTSAIIGVAFLTSIAVGRPLAGMFASDMYTFPPEVRASETFTRVFTRVSLAWALFMLARSAVRIVILTGVSLDTFVLIDAVTNAPLGIAMMCWSVWYGRHAMQRSAEWGWVFTGEARPPGA